MKKNYVFFVLLFLMQSVLVFNSAAACPARGAHGDQSLDPAGCPAYTDKTFEYERHRVWINLTNSQGLFKQILIAYVTGATNGYDHNYDAPTMDANKYADFYSISQADKLAIQGRAVPFDASDTVPLGYRSIIKGDLTISIDHADGDLDVINIYLEDKATGSLHNLKNGGYTFSTIEGTFTERFVIRYIADKKLGLHDAEKIPQHFSAASRNQIISLKSSPSALKKVSVFDITGKLLYNCPQVGTSEHEITSIQAGPQILLVKATLENEEVQTRKVLF
ncbi:T9SS sorting signal type C domain-containing protein [Flavobacterium ginsengiterrae]